MGFADPGFMRKRFAVAQDRAAETPALDRLAAEGLSFTDAHAGAPVCAPSRCAFMTGLHSGRCPVRDNDVASIAGVEQTWASLLADQGGYRTALFGKWGLGTLEQGAFPTEKGFATFVGQVDQTNCHNYYPAKVWSQESFDYVAENVHASYESCGGAMSLRKCRWSGDIFTREAVAFMQRHVETRDSRPFAIFVSHTTPHAGDVGSNMEHGSPVPRIDASPFADNLDDWGLVEVQYAAAVAAFDAQTAKVLDALDALNLTADTLVMFSSDNGASNEGAHSYKFFDSSGPLRGFKRSLSEGGHRVPLVLRWPGVLPQGRWTDVHFNFYDWLPTLAGILGFSLQNPDIDGTDKSKALLGEDAPPVASQYMEHCAPNEYPRGFGQLVRRGSLAFLCYGPRHGRVPACKNASDLEVYNLAADLGQAAQLNPDSISAEEARTVLAIMHREHKPGSHCGQLLLQTQVRQ